MMVFDLRHWLLLDLRQLLAFGLELEYNLCRFGACASYEQTSFSHLYMCTSYWFPFLWRTLTNNTGILHKDDEQKERKCLVLIISLVNELTNSNSRLYYSSCYVMEREGERKRYMIHLKLDLLLLVTYSQKHNLTISVMETFVLGFLYILFLI